MPWSIAPADGLTAQRRGRTVGGRLRRLLPTMQPSCPKPRQWASGTLRWPANCSCSAALAQPRGIRRGKLPRGSGRRLWRHAAAARARRTEPDRPTAPANAPSGSRRLRSSARRPLLRGTPCWPREDDFAVASRHRPRCTRGWRGLPPTTSRGRPDMPSPDG